MFCHILAALRRLADRKRISNRLRALDDHQLHDLGVARDQIGAFVRAASYLPEPRPCPSASLTRPF